MARKTMTSILLGITVALATCTARAQDDGYIIAREPSATFETIFQSWSSDGYKLSEFSAPLSLYFPLGREFAVEVRTALAATSGDFQKLSGLNNVHAGFTYHLQSPDIVLALGTGLPTGKKELTQAELQTSVLVSNPAFGFRIPGFGEGTSLDAGAIWAFQTSDNVVFGAGASYYYRGSYAALEGYDDYDPGDELLFTGGVDVQLAEASNLSFDASFTTYSADKLGDKEVFSSGNRLVAYSQYSRAFGDKEFWLMARVRTKGKGSVAIGGVLLAEAEKTEPNQYELMGSYSFPVAESVSLKLLAEGRIFDETPSALSGLKLVGFGVQPWIKFSSSNSFNLKFMYRAGSLKAGKSISSFEIGAGIVL